MNSKTFFFFIVFLLLGIAGYSQTINLDANTTGSTITTCSATLYDSGGPDGNYSANENYTITFCSGNTAQMVVNVLALRTEGVTFDYLRIYDGSDNNSDLLATLGGTTVPSENEEIITTGNCITFVWHSDNSTSYAGFELSIRCGIPCQDYNVSITPDLQYDTTLEGYIGCPGGRISAQIDFPNNNVNYEQTVDNTMFSWTVWKSGSIETFSGLGMDELSETLASGACIYSLTTTDANHCQYVTDNVTVYVSLPPSFAGTYVPTLICSGTEIELHGSIEPPDEWRMTVESTNIEQHCFDDNHINEEQYSCFDITDFTSELTITSISDIRSVGINIEHSFMGELDIFLQCPNGQRTHLFNRSCGTGFFGEAIDTDSLGINSCNDGPEYVGIGYDYYWTEGENMGTMADNCPENYIPLPSGYYQPIGSFSDLIGCPVNGEWCVVFIDHLSLDDGTIFRAELNFADYFRPPNNETVEVFRNTYGNEMWWEGNNLQTSGLATDNIATPTVPGISVYTFHATDNFGCTFDTTVYVTMYEVPTASFLMNEEDTVACGLTFDRLQADDSFAGYWYEGSSSALFGDDNSMASNPQTSATVADYGSYDFYWVARNGSNVYPGLCTDTVGPWRVNFLPTPTAQINEDEAIFCGYWGEIEAEPDSIGEGIWETNVPSDIISFVNASSPTTIVSTWEYNTYYNLYWTVKNTESCVDRDSIMVLFSEVPSGEFSVVPPKCIGEPAIVVADVDSLPTYIWNFDDGTTTSTMTNSAQGNYGVLVSWDHQQSHTISLTTANSFGCQSNTRFATIDEPYHPTYSFIVYGDTCAMSRGGIDLIDGNGYYTFFWLDDNENSENATGFDHETGVITDSHVYNLPAGRYIYHAQYPTFNSEYNQSYQQYFNDIYCHSYHEIEISVVGKLEAGMELSDEINIGSIATPDADVIFVNTTDYDSIYNTVCYWDFGDGTTEFSCDSLVEHTYTEPCRYFPYLVVHNRDLPECRDTAFLDIMVNRRVDTVVNAFYFEYEDHTYYVNGQYLISKQSDNGCYYTLILNISGLNDIAEYEYGLRIFPNPAGSLLNIESQENMSAVEIISATGQVLKHLEVDGNNATIDVGEFVEGLYLLRIYGDCGEMPMVQKFVKE